MPLTRSQQMARIRGRNTVPEKLLRSALTMQGVRYRLNFRTPFGRADLAIPGVKVAVFVDGCFWHGCPEHYVRPRSSIGFWAEKLRANVERDIRQTADLEADGWKVCRAWEHEVCSTPDAIAARVRKAASGQWRRRLEWRVIRVEPMDPTGSQERRTLVELRGNRATRRVRRPRTTAKWRPRA